MNGRIFGEQGSRCGPLTKSLAVEWASRGVRVNAIAPGVFRLLFNQKLLDETERGREFLLRTPMRRFVNVDELACAAIFWLRTQPVLLMENTRCRRWFFS